MKKFGTPSGAGPGNENANVGFDGDGTPPAPRKIEGVAPAEAGANDPRADPVKRACEPPDATSRRAPARDFARAEECWRTARPAATGATGVDGAAVALDEAGDGLETGAASGAGAAHDSDTDTTPNLIGRLNADTGVPAGTLPVNVNE
jgi:hypothetical protein